MESEKVMYWTTLGVLALATITGFATEHGGWGDRLAERSIALVSQASEVAADYAGMVDSAIGSSENHMVAAPRAVFDIQSQVRDEVQNEIQSDVQPRLACLQRTLVRHQVQMAKVQAMKYRIQALKLVPRTIVLPQQNIVIEVPQVPETPEDTF